MPRALVLVALVLACADTRDAASVSAPAPERANPAMDESSASNPDTLEPLALRCDGAAFARLDAATLADLDDGPSARLLARWEAARSFSAEGSIEPLSIDAMIEALTQELESEPPRWWVDQLASAKLSAGDQGLCYYDVGLTRTGDRRGELVPGPGSTRVRPGVAMALSEADGVLFFDLGLGRVELGTLPTEPDTILEIARARAGSTLYVASFSSGVDGFRFPLRAVGSDGRQRWQAEVCGPDRKVLAGMSHLTVEIVVLKPPPEPGTAPGMNPSSGATGIAVFTAESHGVALDVFDPQTGARTLAWSSDFWFARA